MTLVEFRQSLTATQPPAGLTLALAGLWWDAKGDWTRAHESAQQDEGKDGSWVHAYTWFLITGSKSHKRRWIFMMRPANSGSHAASSESRCDSNAE
jgi:hypothetical protein